jgi:hypothetical protein
VQGEVSICLTPEEPLPRFLAQVYSFNSPSMRTSTQEYMGSAVFDRGTTNGAKYYPVLGSLQVSSRGHH